MSTIVQSQFYIETNQSNISFKISSAAAHILAAKPHPSKTNVPLKILRTGTVCRYFLRR